MADNERANRVEACVSLAEKTSEPAQKLLLAELAHAYASTPEAEAATLGLVPTRPQRRSTTTSKGRHRRRESS
jgi:hypothetical protein